MTPDQFKKAAAALLDRKKVSVRTEIEIGEVRTALDMNPTLHMTREQWAADMNLRVVATRTARRGQHAWVLVGDVCRELENPQSPLSRGVWRSAYMKKARTKGQEVQKSEAPTLVETPQIEVSELYEEDAAAPVQTDAVALRNIGMRLDDMAARLNHLQQCTKANTARLRCIGRKLDAIVKAWEIEVPPDAENEMESALSALLNNPED